MALSNHAFRLCLVSWASVQAQRSAEIVNIVDVFMLIVRSGMSFGQERAVKRVEKLLDIHPWRTIGVRLVLREPLHCAVYCRGIEKGIFIVFSIAVRNL